MNVKFIFFLLTVLLLAACQPEDNSPLGRYREAVQTGIDSDEAQHDLFMGLELRMTDQEFYDRCTELNRQQLITMGGGGNTVDRRMPNELARPAIMTFHPIFSQEDPRRINAMELKFIYEDWAPWNKDASGEKLLPDVARYLGHELGGELMEVPHPQYGRTLVRVDDNRHTAIWMHDDTEVVGVISDLSQLERDPLGLLP